MKVRLYSRCLSGINPAHWTSEQNKLFINPLGLAGNENEASSGWNTHRVAATSRAWLRSLTASLQQKPQSTRSLSVHREKLAPWSSPSPRSLSDGRQRSSAEVLQHEHILVLFSYILPPFFFKMCLDLLVPRSCKANSTLSYRQALYRSPGMGLPAQQSSSSFSGSGAWGSGSARM